MFKLRSSFSDFAQKYGKDERFKGIEKMRDREGLFNEYILEVRRREKDEKNQKKETVSKILFSYDFFFVLFIRLGKIGLNEKKSLRQI